MTDNQVKRLKQLLEYAHKMQDHARAEKNTDDCNKWVNVAAWVLLIQADQ